MGKASVEHFPRDTPSLMQSNEFSANDRTTS